MEQIPDTIYFERQHIYNIRGVRIIVNSHFDDTQEGLRDKIARLLKNDVSKLTNPEKSDTMAA
jgi:hypothetical protein